MSDGDLTDERIVRLERLDRLRTSGGLSQDEFEAEKARLFAAEPLPPPGAAPSSARGGRVGLLALALGVPAVAAAAYVLTPRAEPNEQPGTRLEAKAEKAATGAAPAAAAGLRALPLEEQQRRAARAAFGDPEGATVAVKIEAEGADPGAFEDVAYTPRELIWIGDRAVLLSEGKVVDAGHVNAGKVAAHYLRVEGDGFRVVSTHLSAVLSGSMGTLAGMSVRRDLLETPVLMVEGGGTWQGYTCTGLQFVRFDRGKPEVIGNVPNYYSDDGAIQEGQDPLTIEGRTANAVKGKSFSMIYEGERSFTERYVLEDGRYRLEGGASQMETC